MKIWKIWNYSRNVDENHTEDEEDLDRQEFTQLLTVLTLYVANNYFGNTIFNVKFYGN